MSPENIIYVQLLTRFIFKLQYLIFPVTNLK